MTQLDDKIRAANRELELLEKEKKLEIDRQNKEHNYELFKKRKTDAVIGLAHMDLGKSKHKFGNCVSIHGNCGTSYSPEAYVCDTTYIFFHNVWTHEQQHEFQEAINTVAIELVKKYMGGLRQVLDLIGLQRGIATERTFPIDKLEEINNDIWKATCDILDKYPDEDFLKLITVQTGWVDSETKEPIPPYKDIVLSHSRTILFKYINEKRKNLIEAFKEVRHWESVIDSDGE